MARRNLSLRCVVLVTMLSTLLVSCSSLMSTTQRDTILFGATISITGTTAKEGEHTRDGYMLFVETINKQGGITVGGKTYRVALQYYDDESRPERAAELYEKLVNEDQVDFLLGPYGSGPTDTGARVAEHYKIPMVEGSGAADSIFARGNRYIFGVLSPASSYLFGIIDLAVTATPPLKTVAILYADDIFAREVAAGAAAYAQTRGLSVVYQQAYAAETQDVSPLLTEIKALQPDLLLGASHLQDALLVVRQARALQVRPRAMGFSVGPSSPEFRKNLKSDADYIFGASQWTSTLKYQGDDPWGTPDAFAAAFKTRYPDYKVVPYTAASSAAVLVAYTRAIEQAGSLEHAAVRDALDALSITTFYGPIAFDDRGINSVKPMAVEQLQPDGQQYTVFPRAMAEREALFPAQP